MPATVTGRYQYRGTNHDTVCGDQKGTMAGAQRHYYRGEKPCEACRAGANAYNRERSRRAGVKPRTIAECGTAEGYRRHLYLREVACRPCVDAEAARALAYQRSRGVQPRKLRPCGTVAAYLRHHAHGEPACDACAEAHRMYKRRSYQRRVTRIDCKAPQPCSPAGYEWHLAQGEEPCPACTRWHTRETREVAA